MIYGYCKVCGKPLKNDMAKIRGMGDDCYKKYLTNKHKPNLISFIVDNGNNNK